MTNSYSYYPLTYPQKNIYQTEITYPGTSISLITATMKITDEDIDFEKVEKALNLIIQYNDSMRLRVKVINRKPRQYFADYEYEKFEIVDLRNKPIEALYEFDKAQTETPLDLIDNQLYKFTLLWLSENEFGVFLKIHHLISDGWSTVRIGNYILDYYEKLQKGVEIDFTNIPSYKEYILNEKEYLTSELFLKDKDFWSKKFQELDEPSIIKPRKSKLVGIKAERKTFVLPDKLISQLRQYCKETRTSIFGVIMSAFSIYLSRTIHKNEITIGTLVLNRANRRQKNTVGMFISTVPIKVQFEKDMNFINFNKMLTREWMAVLKHQRYPFELLLKDIREKYKDSKDLFDIVFSYQNASFTENTSSKQRSSRWHFNHLQKESLTIHIHDRDDMGKLLIDYDYLENLFHEKEIDFIHDNFIRILWHAIDNPVKPMSDLELISESEKRKILTDFNFREIPVPENKTLVDLFNAQVKKTPKGIALIHEDKKMTYEELNKRSNSLANRLVSEKIEPDQPVCIMVDKSIEMIVAIIGVLKAGGAYLAIDSEFPIERKKYIFADSEAKILITTKKYTENLVFDGTAISISDHDFSKNSFDPQVKIEASDLAYIIYTSGTTGEPKGVMIEHRSVVNYVFSFLDEFKYTGDEIVLEQSSYLFDAFVEEVFPTLASGATLVIANKYGAKDMKKLTETINDQNVTIVSVSPLVLNEMNKINDFKSVKLFISGGDVLKYEYIDNLIQTGKVYNTYGPTETTVCATYHECDSKLKDNIPIGRPVGNYKLFILDKNLNLLPIGVSGELYISGPGLSRGYLNRPELTKEMFIDNPFLPGEKMYKTNDIARWYPMGEIEYVGRADRQIKIRGMRVELGEIESHLLRHDKIKSVVIIAREDDGKQFLCAYYEINEDISIQEIRTFLRNKIPRHMIPSYYLQMDKLPLNASGKVNMKALPDLNNMILNDENEYVGPESEIEEKLILLVQNIINKKKISMKDNFFDLGGDSLSLNVLAFDIIDNFNIDMPLEYLFKANDIKEIADIIKDASKSISHISHERNLVLMHKGTPGNTDLFFIHDGLGGVGAYFELIDNLKEYNIWGVRADINNSLAPKNLTIKELAKKYVEQITKESDGPYNIGGWCIGGTISYEIVCQLEKLNKPVNSLFMIDTIPPISWDNAEKFSVEGEKIFAFENIKTDDILRVLKDTDSIEDIWEEVIQSIECSDYRDEIIEAFIDKIPEDIKQYINDYNTSTTREIFRFINQIRTLHVSRALYFPKGKIKTDICYFGAGTKSVVKDSGIWENYTSGEIEYKTIEGNHNTMIQASGAKHTALAIKEKVL